MGYRERARRYRRLQVRERSWFDSSESGQSVLFLHERMQQAVSIHPVPGEQLSEAVTRGQGQAASELSPEPLSAGKSPGDKSGTEGWGESDLCRALECGAEARYRQLIWEIDGF